jgi:Zn-dependent protease with chaperone function
MNALKTFLLLGLLTALLVTAGNALGGRQGMLLAFGFAVAINAAAYWWSDRIVLRIYRAREVGQAEAPELHRMIGELARRADLPVPRIALIPSETPNAFTTGRNPRNAVVAVTTGLLRHLEPEEIRGVLAREFHADEAAARFVGSPRPLIQALKRLEAAAKRAPLPANPATAHLFIVNPLRGGGLLSLFSTHPPLEKRVARLEVLAR